MNNYFKNRCTIREFQKKEISKELLDNIIAGSVHAPTTGNMQLYSIIITQEPQNIAKLSPSHFNQPASKNAQALITFCIDFNRFEKWCNLRDAKPYYRNFQSFIAAALDATIVAQQFCTIAEQEGLGVCYLGTTTYNASSISELLNLPELVVPLITLAIGYPQQEMKATERLPVEAVTHSEQYQDYNSNDINRLYTPKELLEENQKFVEENNKETLAQVFTDIRYNKENNELFSKLYLEFIKNKGFNFPY